MVLSGKKWTERQRREDLDRGNHQLTLVYLPFLQEEFASMVKKGKWVVLPYSMAKEIPGLNLSPPGVKEERDRRPWWIGDNSFSNLNSKTLHIAAMSSMKQVRASERLIMEVRIADLALGLLYILKLDISDGLYHSGLRPTDAPNMGLVFPLEGEYDKLVAIPLTLPTGCKNSPPIFCMTTEAVEYLANSALHYNIPATPHNLD